MAYEQRRNNKYYYRKRREGDKVISEYVGGGLIGECEALWQDCENGRQYERRQAREKERQPAQIVDQAASELHQITDLMVKAQMLLSGYHQHKGTWRKRRGTND